MLFLFWIQRFVVRWLDFIIIMYYYYSFCILSRNKYETYAHYVHHSKLENNKMHYRIHYENEETGFFGRVFVLDFLLNIIRTLFAFDMKLICRRRRCRRSSYSSLKYKYQS